MAKQYRTDTTVTRHQNPETKVWEEVETKKVYKIKIKPDDEFYMVYIKYMSPYYDLKYADDIKMLGKLCEWAEFDKGVVYLTSGRRKELIEKLSIHNSNISKSIKRLKELKLIDGSDGEFEINPVIFWKGSKASRMEMMRKELIQVKFSFVLEHDIKPTTGIVPNTNFDKA